MTTTLDALKRHLNIIDNADDDELAQALGDATEWVAEVIGKPIDGTSPGPVNRAVRMMAAHLFENREAVIVGVEASETPLGVMDMLEPYRRWY